MKITKDYPGLILTNAADFYKDGDDLGNTYELEGDLVSDDDIVVELCGKLVVHGNITAKGEGEIFTRCWKAVWIVADGSIEAGGGIVVGWGIEAGKNIVAGGGIEAGGDVKAGCGIVAGGDIKAGWGIVVGWGIEAGGDIEAGEDIRADEGIEAGGEIEAGWGVKAGIETGGDIKAGCGIKAGWGVMAGRNIMAGGCIVTGDGIVAGGDIEAKTYIDCDRRIFAGISVGFTSANCNKTIKCAELRQGEICHGELVLTEK